MMKKIIFLFLLLQLTLFQNEFSYSQVIYDYNDFSIFLSDKGKNKGFIQEFEKTPSGEIIFAQNQSNLFNSINKKQARLSFGYTEGYQLKERKPIKLFGDGKRSVLTLYTAFGEQILAFSYLKDYPSRQLDLYYHLINPQSESKENHGLSINPSFKTPYATIHPERFLIANEDNDDFATLIYIPPKADGQPTLISYLLFYREGNRQILKRMEIPYIEETQIPLDFFSFNEEEQILIMGSREKEKREREEYTQLKIYSKSSDSLFESSIHDPSTFYTDISIKKINDKILIQALYKTSKKEKISGVMIAEIDQKGKVLSKKYSAFPSSIQFNINSLNRLNLNSTSFEAINNDFKIIQAYHKGEKTIGVLEYKGVEFRYSGVGFPGNASTVDKFYWTNDLIIYQINEEGEFDWIYEVPKVQRTVNDGGYFLSSAVYLHQDELFIFFNDNQANYNKDNTFYRGEKDLQIAQFNSFKNTIAYVKINTKEGDFTRRCTIGRQETQLILIPSLAVPLPEKDQLFIFASNIRNYRIGRIFFNKEKE